MENNSLKVHGKTSQEYQPREGRTAIQPKCQPLGLEDNLDIVKAGLEKRCVPYLPTLHK